MRILMALFQLLSVVASSSNIQLPDRPWNLGVNVGQNVEMKCKSDNSSKITEWTFHRPLHNDRKTIWKKWKDETKTRNATFDFDVDEDGSVTLSSKSIRLNDAGIYTCVVDKTPKQPERYSAQLIVFESDPRCSTNEGLSVMDGSIKEFDYVSLRCSVNYSGHWTPSMQWSINGNYLSEVSVVTKINISHDVGLQQMLSVVNFQVKAEDNGAMITCNTSFIETTQNVNKTSARNVPEYRFYCNRTLSVLFGPRNVTITPKKDLYQPKDVISCEAAGNPSPSYTWNNTRSQEKIADGPQLALNEVGLEASGRHFIECIAQNKVHDELKQSSATIDMIISNSPSSGNSTIIILTGIICAILFLIVIIIGRKQIKGWIGKLLSVFRCGPANEPDIVPNDNNVKNGVAFNNDVEPYGHYAVPADNLAVGSSANLFEENVDIKSPVYSQINKQKNKAACNTYNRGVEAKTTTQTHTSVGRDGTVYEEVNIDVGRHQSESSCSLLQNPMFNKSEYVKIDHTIDPPIIPPRKK